MEVTTVSPSPASPTGDDLCEIDVTNVAIDGVLLLICLCGLAGNGAFLWLQQRNSITLYIFDLAFVDFLFLLLMVPSALFYLLENMSCSIIMPPTYMRILFLLSLLPYSLGLYLLTALSIERCMSILCPLWYNRLCTQQLLEVVNVVLWALSVGFIVTVSSLCLCQEHKHCQASLISMHAFNLFLFAPVMLISSTILFIRVKSGPQQQQPKRLDIVIFLTMLFILLFSVPLSLCNFLQELGYITVSSQVVFLLICIHSSIKPLIYFLVGSWRRDCSMGSCWRHCSMESCRKHFSIQSLRKALHRVFGEVKENPACRDAAAMDTGV